MAKTKQPKTRPEGDPGHAAVMFRMPQDLFRQWRSRLALEGKTAQDFLLESVETYMAKK